MGPRGNIPMGRMRHELDRHERQLRDRQGRVPRRQHLPLTARLVREGLARLPGKDRGVLELFYFEQLDYDQIARRLGKSATAVGTQLSRARQKLLDRLPP